MNRNLLRLVAFAFLPLAVSARAECPNTGAAQDIQLCRNLQHILYAAQTDFREFTFLKQPAPDLSLGATKVPCQISTWANNVPMFMCYAQVSLAEAQQWYMKSLADLQALQYLWQFKVESPASDHFVDGGPPDCDVPPPDGPHLGQCPLHLQSVKQADGTAKVYLWVNSYSSPYLVNKPPAPPSKSGPRAPSNAPQSAQLAADDAPACDDLCQGLRRVLEARNAAFKDLRVSNSTASNSSGSSTSHTDGAGSSSDPQGSASSPESILKLPGASTCSLDTTPQYVCFWPETSATAGETRFRDLSSRIELAMPSTWSAKHEDALDPLTGAKLTTWLALDSSNKIAVRLFLSGQSVGLHVSAEN